MSNTMLEDNFPFDFCGIHVVYLHLMFSIFTVPVFAGFGYRGIGIGDCCGIWSGVPASSSGRSKTAEHTGLHICWQGLSFFRFNSKRSTNCHQTPVFLLKCFPISVISYFDYLFFIHLRFNANKLLQFQS